MAATVTQIGLGNMGSTLANALIDAGHDVTVWSRSEARRAPFAGRCRVATDAAEACRASDLVISCLIDYPVTRETLGAAADALRGRTLVQCASGGPAEARELAAWAEAHGIAYLDGKISTFPSRIGDSPTIIFYSGGRETFDRHRPVLLAFGGRPTFVGERPGAAAGADIAWLSFLYGATLGLLQGAAFCDTEGVDLAVAFDAVPSWLVEIAAEAAYYRSLIERGDYAGSQATLDVHLPATHHILEAAQEAGVSTGFPALVADVVGAAVARGHGADEFAAVLEVLRAPR
jgi:3-hydroxyisobutyrate dehydrogenase-like beta-hydroxyacid dehydrogenase